MKVELTYNLIENIRWGFRHIVSGNNPGAANVARHVLAEFEAAMFQAADAEKAEADRARVQAEPMLARRFGEMAYNGTTGRNPHAAWNVYGNRKGDRPEHSNLVQCQHCKGAGWVLRSTAELQTGDRIAVHGINSKDALRQTHAPDCAKWMHAMAECTCHVAANADQD